MNDILYVDPVIGPIHGPRGLFQLRSFPGGGPLRPALTLKEIGVCVAVQQRPIYYDEGLIRRFETIWYSITHNERLDAGASEQAKQVFAAGANPAAPSATVYPGVAIAVANTSFTTKTKTDLSIGTAPSGNTGNEFTATGLARATVTSPVGGNYTLPGALGGTFVQTLSKLFTATGNATAHGAALFDSTTVSGGTCYCEDIFGSDAIMVNNDTVTITWSISN